MSSLSTQPTNAFIARLTATADLSGSARQALEGLVGNVRLYAANYDIVRQGDRPSQCCIILEGWVCRNKLLAEGRRQVAALHFAGATPDLQSLFMPVMDHNITTLTEARVGFIPHASLRELLAREPSLALTFWRETVVDAAISREWVVNLGSRQAQERIAHLFCEVATRLKCMGQATRIGNLLTIAWPLSQSQLAEITGLSNVHVNRSLKALRASKMVEITRGWVTIHDLAGLMAFARFNPDYLLAETLHLETARN